MLWSGIRQSKVPALLAGACAAKHWGQSTSRSCSAFSSATKNICLLTSSPSSAVVWVNPFYSTLQQVKSLTMIWLRAGGTFRYVCLTGCDQLASHAWAQLSGCTANFVWNFSLEMGLLISAWTMEQPPLHSSFSMLELSQHSFSLWSEKMNLSNTM